MFPFQQMFFSTRETSTCILHYPEQTGSGCAFGRFQGWDEWNWKTCRSTIPSRFRFVRWRPVMCRRLKNYKVFQEFFWKRRLSSSWNLGNLERDWKDVCKRGLNSPNLEEIYLEKKKEFLNKLIPVSDPALGSGLSIRTRKRNPRRSDPRKTPGCGRSV